MSSIIRRTFLTALLFVCPFASQGLGQGLTLPGGAVEIGAPVTIGATPPDDSSGKTIWVRFYLDGEHVEDFHWWFDVGENPAARVLRIHAPSREGTYDIRMFDRYPYDNPLTSQQLSVLATRDDDALSSPGAAAYEIGEKITVSVAPGQERFLTKYAHVTIFKDDEPWKEGLLDWYGEPGDRGAREFTFSAPDRAGVYEFRFYDRHVWREPHLVSVQPFRVVATRDDDALEIPEKAVFEIGEQIIVRAGPGPDRYFTEFGHVTLFLDGKPLRDGIRQWFGEVGDRSPKEFVFQGPDTPGTYEFRFYDRHLWKEPHLIALKPFEIVSQEEYQRRVAAGTVVDDGQGNPGLEGQPCLEPEACEQPSDGTPGTEFATASSTDPETGETITTTSNPDGSRTIMRTDRDGRVIAVETQGPPGSGAGTLSYVDPETGVTRTIIRDGDGRRRVLESRGWIDPLGDANLLQVDNFGRETELLALSNGISVIEARDILGRADETIILKDGTRMTSRQTPLGDRIETVETPDGLVEIAVYDSAGQLVSQTVRNDDGSATTFDAAGHKRTVSAPVNDGTIEIVDEDPHGNLTRTAYDDEGNVIATKRERLRPYEPGEEYYLNDLKGNIPWDELENGDRTQFANTEKMMRNNRETADFRDAQAEARRLEKELQKVRFAELDAELDAELEKIAAEQAVADKAALTRNAQLELDANRDEVTDQLADLDRRIKLARDVGNLDEQRKLEAEHDELHDASLNLFLPTEAEETKIARRQAVRDALFDEVGGTARTLGDIVYQEMAVGQDRTKEIAENARYAFLGAEMENMLDKTQRVAMREKAGAQGWFEAIEQKLADPETTAEEREILADISDLAHLRQEGGDRLLSDNARIIAAGYATDAALMGLGTASKLALQGGKQLASKVIVERATSAAFAEQIAAGATRGSAMRVARTAGQTALAAAENRVGALQAQFAGTRAGAAVDSLGRVLTKDVQLSTRLARHKVLEAAVVDGVVGASADAGIQLYQTGTVDVAETVRGAVAGSMVAGLHTTGQTATRAIRSTRRTPVSADSASTPTAAESPAGPPGSATIDDPYAGGLDIFDDSDDLLPGPAEPPIGARSRDLSETEIRRLHQPGRNLTAEEIQAKADLYRDLVQRRRAVDEAVKANLTPREVRERVRDLVSQHDRIRAGSTEPGPTQGAPQQPQTQGTVAQEQPVVALNMPEDPNGAWSSDTTRIDGNRRPPGTGTEQFGTEVMPSRQASRPQPIPNDTVVLAEPPTHAGPDDATTILDAEGRPIVRDGELVTTDTPPDGPPRPDEFDPTDTVSDLGVSGAPLDGYFPNRSVFNIPEDEFERLLISHYGGVEKLPPVHRQSYETIEHIANQKSFSPTGDGPHFSSPGSLPRRSGGNIVIRVKPERVGRDIRYEVDPGGKSGHEPQYFPNGVKAGGPPRSVPASHLEYFHPGGDGIAPGWYPIPEYRSLVDRFPEGVAVGPADRQALSRLRASTEGDLLNTRQTMKRLPEAQRSIYSEEVARLETRIARIDEILDRGN